MLIDDLMPYYDVSAQYGTLVNAAPAHVFDVLQHFDFSQSGVIRFLMGLRTLGRTRKHESTSNQNLMERMRSGGFIEVARLENQEIVIGVVGRFWRPDSGVLKHLSSKEILDFHAPGYAKALWNFHLVSDSPHQTRLSTETRIQTFDSSAHRKFRLYWSLIGPFSGWIRKEMLRLIRTQAEQ